MINRVAFFADKEDVEAYYGFNTRKESVFVPSYNISPGNQLIVIVLNTESKQKEIKHIRWGTPNNGEPSGLTIEKEELGEHLKSRDIQRCVVPLSGFFIWKESDTKNQPFFVRMLNDDVMSVAGLYDGGSNTVSLITTASNSLIEPMSEQMPLVLNRALSASWIDSKTDPDEMVKQAEKLYLLTDFSVLKVSKKVNDPKNNQSNLIQPIPK